MQERKRLNRKDTKLIAEKLESLGLHVKEFGQHHSVQAWTADGQDWVCSFFWEAKKGWRLDIGQPIIYTIEDLDTVMIKVENTQKAVKALDQAWGKFTCQRTESNWQEYQGAAAVCHLGGGDYEND